MAYRKTKTKHRPPGTLRDWVPFAGLFIALVRLAVELMHRT